MHVSLKLTGLYTLLIILKEKLEKSKMVFTFSPTLKSKTVFSILPLKKTESLKVRSFYKAIFLVFNATKTFTNILPQLKVAFIQKVRFVFQISKTKYSRLQSRAWNLNLLLAGNLNFKFRIFFWRFEKHIALSEKKPPLLETYLHNQLFTILGLQIQDLIYFKTRL